MKQLEISFPSFSFCTFIKLGEKITRLLENPDSAWNCGKSGELAPMLILFPSHNYTAPMAVELEDVSHLGNQGLVLHHAMQTEDADVLLAGILLRLDQASGTLDANDQTAGDLGVQRSAVAGLVHTQDSFDPGNDFVGRGVGRLVQVDEAAPESPQRYHEPLLCSVATIANYSQKPYQNISLIKMLTLEISQTRYDCNLPIFYHNLSRHS